MAVISVAALVLAAIIWISPVAGLVTAGILALAALVFYKGPFGPIRRIADKHWLTQNTTIAVLFVAMLCGLAAIPLWVKQYRDEEAAIAAAEQARQAAIAAAEQARLQALRQSNPKQYLVELKTSNDPSWEVEFKTLDPTGYAAYLADRKAKQEQQRQASIQQWTTQLALTKPDDLYRQSQIYSELLKLEPTNKDYKAKKDKIDSTLERRRIADEVAEKEASRVRYASTAEHSFLQNHMDVMVRTSGDRNTTITFKYVLMGRPGCPDTAPRVQDSDFHRWLR